MKPRYAAPLGRGAFGPGGVCVGLGFAALAIFCVQTCSARWRGFVCRCLYSRAVFSRWSVFYRVEDLLSGGVAGWSDFSKSRDSSLRAGVGLLLVWELGTRARVHCRWAAALTQLLYQAYAVHHSNSCIMKLSHAMDSARHFVPHHSASAQCRDAGMEKFCIYTSGTLQYEVLDPAIADPTTPSAFHPQVE